MNQLNQNGLVNDFTTKHDPSGKTNPDAAERAWHPEACERSRRNLLPRSRPTGASSKTCWAHRHLVAFWDGSEMLEVNLEADGGLPFWQSILYGLDDGTLHQDDHRWRGQHTVPLQPYVEIFLPLDQQPPEALAALQYIDGEIW